MKKLQGRGSDKEHWKPQEEGSLGGLMYNIHSYRIKDRIAEKSILQRGKGREILPHCKAKGGS